MSVETISGVVAAVAAVGAVYFARDTVNESIAGRKDADEHHEAQIAEMKATTLASAEQHRIETRERLLAHDAELTSDKLGELRRVGDLVLQIYEIAYAENRSKPGDLVPGHGGSRLPPICIRLEIAFPMLYGGKPSTDTALSKLASQGRAKATPAVTVIGLAVDALYEIQQMTTDIEAGYRNHLADLEELRIDAAAQPDAAA